MPVATELSSGKKTLALTTFGGDRGDGDGGVGVCDESRVEPAS